MPNSTALNKPTIVLTGYYQPKPGGLCKRYVMAMQALLEAGFRVHCVSYEPFSLEHPNYVWHPLKYFNQNRTSLLFWTYSTIAYSLVFFYLNQRLKPHIFFSFSTFYSACFQLTRWIRPCRHLLFFRADTLKNAKIKKRPKVTLWINWLIEAISIVQTQTIFVSETLQQDVFNRHLLPPPKKTSVLKNNINCIKEKNFSHKEIIRFGCAGILEKRKNQQLLIDVFSKLKKSHQLYIFGIGPEELLLREQTNKNGSTNIHFMGWCESSTIFTTIDCFLAPSLHEGISNAILEAIENGIPILASDIPEHQEILPSAQLLQTDVNTWIERIDQIDNKKLTEITHQQNISCKHLLFDWKKTLVELFYAQ
jgi:glycosyltransferase involved in cell wall biosynthesis